MATVLQPWQILVAALAGWITHTHFETQLANTPLTITGNGITKGATSIITDSTGRILESRWCVPTLSEIKRLRANERN